MVPVNLRGEDAHDQAGNRVTSLFVELPTGEDDPRRRYERTCEAAERLKSSSAARGGSTLVLLTGLMPPLLHEPISQTLFAPRLFNLTVTNVPGPQYPLYSMGSRMRQIIPLVPLFADHSLGIAIVSYDGTLTFGLNADRAAVPDLPLLERALREELGTLLRLARKPPDLTIVRSHARQCGRRSIRRIAPTRVKPGLAGDDMGPPRCLERQDDGAARPRPLTAGGERLQRVAGVIALEQANAPPPRASALPSRRSPRRSFSIRLVAATASREVASKAAASFDAFIELGGRDHLGHEPGRPRPAGVEDLTGEEELAGRRLAEQLG